MLRITAAGKYSRVIKFQKDKIMKNIFVLVISCTLLCALLFALVGCSEYYAQPGETAAEGHRRHLRNLSVNHQNMMRDLDLFWLSDKPDQATIFKIE
jgi:hypothetical protein